MSAGLRWKVFDGEHLAKAHTKHTSIPIGFLRYRCRSLNPVSSRHWCCRCSKKSIRLVQGSRVFWLPLMHTTLFATLMYNITFLIYAKAVSVLSVTPYVQAVVELDLQVPVRLLYANVDRWQTLMAKMNAVWRGLPMLPLFWRCYCV